MNESDYEVEYVTERATVGFNQIDSGCPEAKVDRFTLDQTPNIPMDVWLYSVPKTIRKLRFQNNHYIL